LAYQELAIGVACMIGPLLGGLVYGLFGFFYTFVGMKFITQFIYYYLLLCEPSFYPYLLLFLLYFYILLMSFVDVFC
jgi:hypothetical protein